MRHPASAYRQFSVQGSTPLGLVVMLYDGVIADMQRAVGAIEAHDIQKKCAHISRALAIIAQLEGTLNFEKGGEVAQTLKSLYVYARAQAMKANLENSPEILRSLIEKFTTVREAWNEADHQPSAAPETPAGSGGEIGKREPSAERPSAPPGPRRQSPYGPTTETEGGSWNLSA
jgi:flagellar protein FliS